jgi:hypothetical protein
MLGTEITKTSQWQLSEGELGTQLALGSRPEPIINQYSYEAAHTTSSLSFLIHEMGISPSYGGLWVSHEQMLMKCFAE